MRKSGDVVRADVVEDDRGKSKGYGLVEFKNSRDADRAIKDLNGVKLDGRAIYVKPDEDIRERRGREDQGQGGGRDGRDGRDGGSRRGTKDRGHRGGRSRSRSGSYHNKSERGDYGSRRGVAGPGAGGDGPKSGKQVYVGNMPFSVTKSQLRDAFKDFGEM